MNLRSSMLVLLLTACSCGSPADGPNTSDAASETDSDMGGDERDAGDAGDESPAGEFEVGVNPAFDSQPESFRAISDGSEVPMTWGVQGSWMVVLAFRSRDVFTGTFDVIAAMTIDGKQAGNIWLEGQETSPGADGWNYYTNLFLALDVAEPPPQGTPATIAMRVTDEEGVMMTRELDVTIGPPAE